MENTWRLRVLKELLVHNFKSDGKYVSDHYTQDDMYFSVLNARVHGCSTVVLRRLVGVDNNRRSVVVDPNGRSNPYPPNRGMKCFEA